MIGAGSADFELAWRPVHHGDAEALFALWQQIEEHDDPPYRSTREELDESFVTQWTGLTENSIAGFDETGRLCAFGLVSVPPDDAGPVRVFLDGGVCPDHRHRGLGSAILEWQIERARGVLAETGNGTGTIVVHVEDGMDRTAHLVQRYGFTETGYHTEMRRDLSLELPEVTVQRPLSVEPWSAELDDQIRLAHNDAFSAIAQAQSATVWTEGRTYFVPEWSFLVLDRTTDRAQVAGYLLASKYEQDWATLGWSEGYVDMLGVRAPWRGQRIATSLLVRAMRAFAESGMEYAALGVDHTKRQDALRLFDKLGFEPTRGSTTYTIEV